MLLDHTFGKITAHKTIVLYVDGGCEPKNPGGIATCGWVIYDAEERKAILAEEYRVVADGGKRATNNYAEYCGLGFALRWLKDQKWRGQITIHADSKLLVEHVNRNWRCKAAHLQPLLARIHEYLPLISENSEVQTFTCGGCNYNGHVETLLANDDEEGLSCPQCQTKAIVFDDPQEISCKLIWVPREQNTYADSLTQKAYQEHRHKKMLKDQDRAVKDHKDQKEEARHRRWYGGGQK